MDDCTEDASFVREREHAQTLGGGLQPFIKHKGSQALGHLEGTASSEERKSRFLRSHIRRLGLFACGGFVGVYTCEWGKRETGWGRQDWLVPGSPR